MYWPSPDEFGLKWDCFDVTTFQQSFPRRVDLRRGRTDILWLSFDRFSVEGAILMVVQAASEAYRFTSKYAFDRI